MLLKMHDILNINKPTVLYVKEKLNNGILSRELSHSLIVLADSPVIPVYKAPGMETWTPGWHANALLATNRTTETVLLFYKHTLSNKRVSLRFNPQINCYKYILLVCRTASCAQGTFIQMCFWLDRYRQHQTQSTSGCAWRCGRHSNRGWAELYKVAGTPQTWKTAGWNEQTYMI